MPRRKKFNLSLEERITNTEAAIEELAAQLKAKKTELKQLKLEKQAADSQRLIEAMAASGKTVDDILEMLQSE